MPSHAHPAFLVSLHSVCVCVCVCVCVRERERERERERACVCGGVCACVVRSKREVSAADNGNSCRKADGGAMLPEELRLSPGEGLLSQAGKVLRGAIEHMRASLPQASIIAAPARCRGRPRRIIAVLLTRSHERVGFFQPLALAKIHLQLEDDASMHLCNTAGPSAATGSAGSARGRASAPTIPGRTRARNAGDRAYASMTAKGSSAGSAWDQASAATSAKRAGARNAADRRYASMPAKGASARSA